MGPHNLLTFNCEGTFTPSLSQFIVRHSQVETDMKRIAIPIAILAFSGIALAHPHKDDTPSETANTERIWPYFGKKKQDKKDTQDSTEKSKTLSASDFALSLIHISEPTRPY